MKSAIKKLYCIVSLGMLIIPSFSFAASINPFSNIERTDTSTTETVVPADTQPLDTATPLNTETTSSTPIESFQNRSSFGATETAPLDTQSAITASATLPASDPASPLSNVILWDKDVQGEAKIGEDNKLRYEKLSDFAGRFNNKLFWGATGSLETGERWVRNLIVTIARDAKNFFTILAFVLLIIVILMSFFWGKWDEDAKRLKSALIYTSLGIMLMQVSFVFINALFNKDVGAGGGATGIDFYKVIILPIINLVRLLASFVFLAMAFFAFFQMVTAGWDPKAREKGITTIISAIVGFVLIKLAEVLVTSVYGKIDCPTVVLGRCQWNLLTDPNLSDTLKIFTTIINYANGFIALITLLIILYAGWNIIFNGEEGMKKWKGMIKWIVVGLLLLVTSYILFRFFILKG